MKRNSNYTERKLARALRPHPEWRVLPTAFLATMLALPVNAGVIIPPDPLASGVRVAPNILFILDDSGSMAWENINNGDISALTGSGGFNDGPGKNGIEDGYQDDLSDDTGKDKTYEQNYITNTLYYNPSLTYQPWMDATGNRLIGGTAYNDAYSSNNFVDYNGVDSNTSSAQINLSLSARTFYAPKSTTGSLSDIANYYRYRIPSGGSDVVRAEYGQVTSSSSVATGFPKGGLNLAKDGWLYYTVDITSGISSFTVSTSNGTGDADLYVRYGSGPTTSQYVCRSNGGNNNETCTVSSPAIGTYYIGVLAYSAVSNLSITATLATTNSCDGDSAGSYGWINCTSNRPEVPNANGIGTFQRSVDDEKINFATWYSYYRTRIKTAKGGAAEAFNTQGNKVRVGYRSLHGNNSNSNFDIPVKDNNDGRFVNNDGTNGNPATSSRSKWFNRLFKASADNGTPLQWALNSAGTYFQGTGDSGPYGPEPTASQLSCRQNFAILTTDGYWNEKTNGDGGRVDTDTGNYGDGSNGSTITNGPALADGGVAVTDTSYKTYQYTRPYPYRDGNSNTLADVAMKYWKTDLRMDLANNVPSDYSKVAAENDQIGRDPAFWQHMVTFGISIGLKAGTGLSSVSDVSAATAWGTPVKNGTDNIKDLLHAAVNGRGTFVSASSPQAFADGLEAALAKISERTASFSNVGATSSTELKTNTLIFSASYVSGRWTGLLRAENAVTGAESWKTTNTGIFPAYNTRNIHTRGGNLTGGVGGSGTLGGTTFPTTQQTTALTRTGGPANYEVSGADNAEYIKGNQIKEGVTPGKLRPRATILGDIVNSSPAFVTDTNTVYIGGNDGMLHAFNAGNGQELFAYVPGIINFGNLADVSRRDYDHRWFVDGPITISSRPLSPDGTKNILVGSLGRGGKGVYALDVTTPTAFTSSHVKWEMNSTSTTAADDHMGMVLGAPVLAKVRTGASTSAVVLGNGINSSSDKAALIVLNMNDGSVIRQIDTSAYGGPASDNGLFAPTGIYAADGKTLVYVYAGDLQGNVWKFDLTSSSPASWSAKKIFQAKAGQAITGGIATAIDARTNKRWVFFGTGSFMTAADGNDVTTNSQSMYGVIDDITTASAYGRTDLVARTVSAPDTQRWFQELTGVMMGTKKGWYVDLPDKGERIVQNAQVDGSFLVTASMMPSGNSCADAAGSGYINAITPFPDMQISGKSYFDLDGDGNTDDAGTGGNPTGSIKTNGIPTLPLLLPGQGRYGTADGVGKYNKGRPQWNRVSWRELRED